MLPAVYALEVVHDVPVCARMRACLPARVHMRACEHACACAGIRCIAEIALGFGRYSLMFLLFIHLFIYLLGFGRLLADGIEGTDGLLVGFAPLQQGVEEHPETACIRTLSLAELRLHLRRLMLF